MTGRGHKTIEHTADMGICGWGKSPVEAFEETASAMFGLMVERKGVDPSKEMDIRCEGGDQMELLIEFLNVLLSKADIEEVVFLAVSIDVFEKKEKSWMLEARARGIERRNVMDRLLTEVKAATYYGASVMENEKGTWEARCVVDL